MVKTKQQIKVKISDMRIEPVMYHIQTSLSPRATQNDICKLLIADDMCKLIIGDDLCKFITGGGKKDAKFPLI